MKTTMIWGADGGIGQALVQELVHNDWQVFAASRRPERAANLGAHSIEADVSQDFSVQDAVTSVSYEVEAIDLWIYAVGDITAVSVGDMSPTGWQRILDANLSGAYRAIHYSLPLLAPDAHIFFLGAVSERLRLPSLSAYAAAKAGVEAFAEALRKEERKRRVTVVRPGAVDTPLWEKVPMKLPRHYATPQKVAVRILQAYADKHSGQLDLT